MTMTGSAAFSQSTLTPAQQAAKAKAEHDATVAAGAKMRAQHDAEVAAAAKTKAQHDAELTNAAQARARHDAEIAAAAKGRAEHDARVADFSEKRAAQANATTAVPAANEHHNPWEARRAEAIAAHETGASGTTAAQPAAATTAPSPRTHFWDTPAAVPAGTGTAPSRSSASTETGSGFGKGAGHNNFAAGLYRFTYSDTSAVVYGCLRKDTRVFCDYDEFKNTAGQANANWGAQMILSGGRILNQHSATYVGPDGSSFPTAELNPSTGVRMLVEYDDVPTNQGSVVLVLGAQRSPTIPITDMMVREDNSLAPRGYGGAQALGQQPVNAGSSAQTATTGTTTSTGDPIQNTTDKINNTSQKASDTKQKLGGLWNAVKSSTSTTTPPK